MIKSAFVIGALALTLGLGISRAATAQDVAVPAGLDVPASLKVPTGNQLFLHVYAKGIQT